MGFFKGIIFNFRGLKLGLKTPKLLALGLLRFFIMTAITIGLAGIVLVYQQDILTVLWARPENQWVLWLWYLLSWTIALFLIALSTVFSYLLSQIFFSVLVMDSMSRITEDLACGQVRKPVKISWFKQMINLVKQEIPRTLFPVILVLILSILGWLTPLGPIISIFSSITAVIFMAWDNTDLVPARQFKPFRERVRFLAKHVFFHLGFGLIFLVPFVNILFLSFAPVGGTLYYCEQEKQNNGSKGLD